MGASDGSLGLVEETLERPLTRAQEARRQRVLDAAINLAAQGGYDAVQMRDVANEADVAMGTVYRYFTSKDHLLAEALVFWVEQMQLSLAEQSVPGSTPADRVMYVLDRALRALNRQPILMGAVFLSLSSPDPAAVQCQMKITELMVAIVLTAIGEPAPVDTPDRSRMIGHIWYSALVGWVNGWSSIERVHDELATATELLLPNAA
jgi:AcrR family transcriptional regulator